MPLVWLKLDIERRMEMDIKACKELCWECRTECQDTLATHCLQKGGEHVAPEHVKLMLDCIQICQTAADFMGRQSSLHAYTCEACAAVCEACAQSCRKLEGEQMKHCAETCSRCAESCREMSRMKRAA
jgi:hypothetical protein